jgi:O-acetyl-ADP-ribose deacetylase (regulator of RNase III)
LDRVRASQRASELCNLVSVQLADFRVQALADSGSMMSLLSARVFEKMKAQDARTNSRSFDYRSDTVDMMAANRSPLHILACIDTQIQIAGVAISMTLYVVKSLAYDLILGLDMLQQTRSIINLANNTLSIYDGLIHVPLMRALSASTVYTVCNVSIPPMSQAILQVKAPRMKFDNNFIIEGDTFAPHKSLLVGKTLVSGSSKVLQCLVLNPSDKPVHMRSGTPLGSLHPVSAITQLTSGSTDNIVKDDSHLSHHEMRQVLEEKGLQFNDTAATGDDFHKLIELLYSYRDLMASSLLDLHPEGADVPPYVIDIGNALPVRQKQYKLSPDDKKEVDRQVAELLQAGIIAPSNSPFINPLVVVSKANGSKRVCVDTRKLNSLTRLTAFPLPTMSDVIDQMSEMRPIYFSSLDLFSGYHQIPLDPASRDKTAFMTSSNVYEFTKLCFGLSNAVNGFNERMLGILGKLASTFCAVYLDDITVMARSQSEMRDNLKQVFDRFRAARIKLNGKKCHFGTDRIVYLGHVFAAGTVSPNTSKFKIIEEFPACKTVKQVRQFLGLVGFFRRFIKDFSKKTYPLRMLLKQSVKFQWTEDCELAFRDLKQALMTQPVLQLPDPSKNYYVFCDASRFAIGYWIGQKHVSGQILPVCYSGRSLSPAERNYTISELECLSMVCCLKEFRHLISNQLVTYVHTDHISLSYLKTMPLSKNARLVRWSMYLAGYQLEIIYKSAANMQHVDALSRIDRSQNTSSVLPPTGSDATAVKTINTATTTTMINDLSSTVKPSDSSSGRIHVEFVFDSQTTSFSTMTAATAFSTMFPNHEEVKIEQQLCPDFKDMYAYLAHGELPSCDKAARKILLDKDNYILDSGALYHLYRPRTKKLDRCFAEIKQLCIPSSMRALVAQGLHDNVSHPGFERTYATSRFRYYFKDQYTFLKNHVISCEACQKSKPPVNQGQVPIQNLPIREPLSYWVLDHHGAIASSSQYKYILVAIDSGSMWVELIPVTDTSAKTTIQALFDCVISRFGLCAGFCVQSDRGSSYANELAKAFCDTFGIKHYFSSPGHAQTNARAEKLGQVIYQSLKTLTDNDLRWSDSLQAVAMAYRGTCTTNNYLSPFEILFGRKMLFHCDFALLAEQPALGSALAYADDIRPKLKVLHEIAMQNSKDSAEKASSKANVGSKEPKFTVGSKVLLLDRSAKRGQSRKLKRSLIGPFIVIQCLENHNYRIKHLVTGFEPKNAIHANRLRTFHELDNDYRLRSQGHGVVLFEHTLTERPLEIQVTVGNILTQPSDIALNPTDCLLTHDTGISRSVRDKAGDSLIAECRSYIDQNGPLKVAQPIITTSGKLTPDIRQIMHVVGPDCNQDPFKDDPLLTQKTLELAYFNCLKLADETAGSNVLTMPAIGANFFGVNQWPLAHAVASAIKQFVNDTTHAPGHLKRVVLVNLTLSLADIMSVVFRELFPVDTVPPLVTDTLEQVATPSHDNTAQADMSNETGEWFEIDCLLKRKRQKGRDLFLVKWKTDDSQPSWEPRSNITPFAIQQFYKAKKAKRKSKHV